MDRLFNYYGHCDACEGECTDLTPVDVATTDSARELAPWHRAYICGPCAMVLDSCGGDPIVLLRLLRNRRIHYTPNGHMTTD